MLLQPEFYIINNTSLKTAFWLLLFDDIKHNDWMFISHHGKALKLFPNINKSLSLLQNLCVYWNLPEYTAILIYMSLTSCFLGKLPACLHGNHAELAPLNHAWCCPIEHGMLTLWRSVVSDGVGLGSSGCHIPDHAFPDISRTEGDCFVQKYSASKTN